MAMHWLFLLERRTRPVDLLYILSFQTKALGPFKVVIAIICQEACIYSHLPIGVSLVCSSCWTAFLSQKLTNLNLLLSFFPLGGINICWYRLQYFVVGLLVCPVKEHMLDLPNPMCVHLDWLGKMSYTDLKNKLNRYSYIFQFTLHIKAQPLN